MNKRAVAAVWLLLGVYFSVAVFGGFQWGGLLALYCGIKSATAIFTMEDKDD